MTASVKDRQDISIKLMAGMTKNAIHEKYGYAVNDINDVASTIGWEPSWRLLAERHRETLIKSIVRLAKEAGLNLREIGEIHNISRERVRQILAAEGINIKDIKKKRLENLSKVLFQFLSSGKFTDADAAREFGVSNSMVTRARKLFTPAMNQKIEEAKFDEKTMVDASKMALARSMWENHQVKEIAEEYEMSTEYMNQLILKFRKAYGWFPKKREDLAKDE